MGQTKRKGVAKRFGDAEVISPLNLSTAEGEFVVFVGSSGCGKSTLLRLIAGLEDTVAGVIEIDGHDATTCPPPSAALPWCFKATRFIRTCRWPATSPFR